jgi:hypothetical protein
MKNKFVKYLKQLDRLSVFNLFVTLILIEPLFHHLAYEKYLFAAIDPTCILANCWCVFETIDSEMKSV